jgi:hypothetical protein
MQIDKAHTVELLMSLEEEMLLGMLVRFRDVSLQVEWDHLVKLLKNLLEDKQGLTLVKILVINISWIEFGRQDQIVAPETLFE